MTQAVTFTYSLLSGDCTATSGGAITCTKTGGVAFGTFATANAATPPSIGSGTPAAGAFSTLSASGAVSGNGFISLFSNTPAIGNVTPNSGAFTTLTATTPVAIGSGGTGQTSANAAFNALSPMTTVGDVIYGAASGVATRLANGTSGMFLGANTGAAPSWQTPAGGGSLQSYSTGRYYVLEGTGSGAGVASTANVIVCTKGIVLQKLTFSVLTLNITTGGSSNVQDALYNDTNGLPGTLLSSSPSVVDTGTLATNLTLSSNVQTGPGTVWHCTNVNDSTVVFTANDRTKPGITGPVIGSKVGAAGLANLVSTAASVVAVSCSGANCNGGSSTFGTWPDLTGSTWTEVTSATAPEMYFQPLSVP